MAMFNSFLYVYQRVHLLGAVELFPHSKNVVRPSNNGSNQTGSIWWVSNVSSPDGAAMSLEKSRSFDQWIGLRENLQETIDCPIKYWVPVNFPLIQSIDLKLARVNPMDQTIWNMLVHQPVQG